MTRNLEMEITVPCCHSIPISIKKHFSEMIAVKRSISASVTGFLDFLSETHTQTDFLMGFS